MSEIKNSKLERSNILSITGCMMSEAGGMCNILPVQKAGLSNTTTNSSSGEYDGGDRVIGLGCYGVDGDLLLTAGWGDGAAIRRLNNDGSMTKLWHDNNALYRDTSSTYNHINSFAFHAGSSQMCLTTHNVNGYSMIDYSDIKDTSTTTNNVVNTRPSSQYVFDDGTVRIDRTGLYYQSGTVTAGTASPLTDGASATLVCEEGYAISNNLPILARIKSTAINGCPPELMGLGPIGASLKALKRAELDINDIDIIELNEAFASQSLACIKELSINPDTVNIEGGAIAIGHPLGATGARITAKAAYLMNKHDKRYALATQCIGLGQGIATILEKVE